MAKLDPHQSEVITTTISKLSVEQAHRFYRFAAEHLPKSGHTERISYKEFERAFGRAGRRMRRISNVIFHRINNYEVGKKCASYILTHAHRRQLMTIAGLTRAAAETIHAAIRVSEETKHTATFVEYHSELVSGVFNYNLRGNRRYHPLQQVPSDLRQILFASHGYIHSYDVSSAIVSLSYRRYLSLGGKPSVLIQEYIDDVGGYRRRLAESLNIPLTDSKMAINTAIHVRAISTSAGFRQDSSLLGILR